MGQYYKIVILADTPHRKEIVRRWMMPGSYAKLMEHAYMDNNYIHRIEEMLSPEGAFYMSRIIWVGDYAENEENLEHNLYTLVENMHDAYYRLQTSTVNNCQYIVNHTQKVYVDKKRCSSVHPLPLLVSEGNGAGGGDYYGKDEGKCGTWARDIISMEREIPQGYSELTVEFE